MLYLISYDMKSGTGRRAKVTKELKKIGAKRAQRSLWVVSTTALDEVDIFDRLDNFMELEDSIVVTKIKSQTTISRGHVRESHSLLFPA